MSGFTVALSCGGNIDEVVMCVNATNGGSICHLSVVYLQPIFGSIIAVRTDVTVPV